ncbi:MAG: heme utilization protein, partial [Candidatus Accumulibacter sp.]|nr:heme utilization protein [Accumulibacter sp.]
QVAALTTDQVVGLTTAQVVALTTSQLAAGLTTSQVAALETRDVAALRTSQVAALATAGVAALTTGQLVTLSTTQVVALTTGQVVALTTGQVAALTTTQVESLTTSQIAAFTTDQISHLTLGTPLILDLDGDGKLSQSISSGVQFDLFATGSKVHTGWVSSTDGLLVRDRNHDGSINDGGELFGSATALTSGERAEDGYAALSAMDSNDDGVIDATDADWSDLSVWVDRNSDGVSQAAELHSLESLDIARLDLDARTVARKDAGNIVGLVSSYETTDGTRHEMADVWFVADKSAADTATPLPADPAGAPDLRANVGNLLQAISSFNSAQAASDPDGQEGRLPQLSTGSSVAANLPGILSVLQQYDANGNAFGASPPTTQAVTTTSLTTVPSLEQMSTGILTPSK